MYIIASRFAWGLGSKTPLEKQKSANTLLPLPKQCISVFSVFLFFADTL
jgi:hypothetical protein